MYISMITALLQVRPRQLHFKQNRLIDSLKATPIKTQQHRTTKKIPNITTRQ